MGDDPKLLIKNFENGIGKCILDKEAKILRVTPCKDGSIHIPANFQDFPQSLLDAVLTAEDRNFFSHPGFDVWAIMRALKQNISARRIVSGASTISQQLARVLNPRPRILKSKLLELFTALRFEQNFTKEQILTYYLNSVHFFGNVRGVEAASMILFNKTSKTLNLAESATLAAAIQAPGKFNPFKLDSNKLLQKRRDWVLRELLKTGKCSRKEFDDAIKLHVPTVRRKLPFNAPHFCDYLEQLLPEAKGKITTTLDLTLHNEVYEIIRSRIKALRESSMNQAACLIIEPKNMEIISMHGSAEYSPIAGGFNNAIFARRSGGSILKPFLYALAFEKSYYPSYVIPDTMQVFRTTSGDYRPENANRTSYGPVTIRSALGNSLNVSAVKMLNSLGLENFYNFLNELRILDYEEGAIERLGLGLAIGNSEVRMYDLGQAYGIFANNGQYKSLKCHKSQKQEEMDFISPESAYMIYDILSDSSARLFTFGNPSFFKTRDAIAIKTGTSTNYRDAWLAAFTEDFIIIIWAGNFDGSPTTGMSGATACGRIFKDIMNIFEKRGRINLPLRPETIELLPVCGTSGKLPNKFCPQKGKDLFRKGIQKPPKCDFHNETDGSHRLMPEYASWLSARSLINDADPYQLMRLDDFAENAVTAAQNSIKILSPMEGDCFIITPGGENKTLLRAVPAMPVKEIIWYYNGFELARSGPPYEAVLELEKGLHTITAISPEDQTASAVTISVK